MMQTLLEWGHDANHALLEWGHDANHALLEGGHDANHALLEGGHDANHTKTSSLYTHTTNQETGCGQTKKQVNNSPTGKPDQRQTQHTQQTDTQQGNKEMDRQRSK